jgi:hypothetical protein
MTKFWTDARVTAFKTVMEKYDEHRTKWIAKFGSDEGYNQWFTQQVMGVA